MAPKFRLLLLRLALTLTFPIFPIHIALYNTNTNKTANYTIEGNAQTRQHE
jgi:hypothetical protein